MWEKLKEFVIGFLELPRSYQCLIMIWLLEVVQLIWKFSTEVLAVK